VRLEVERKLAAQVCDGDRIDVVDGCGGIEPGDRTSNRLGGTLEALGRVIAEARVGLLAADVGAERGIQFDGGVDPLLGDAVDVGRDALRECHGASL
jgi:hypothetical protein